VYGHEFLTPFNHRFNLLQEHPVQGRLQGKFNHLYSDNMYAVDCYFCVLIIVIQHINFVNKSYCVTCFFWECNENTDISHMLSPSHTDICHWQQVCSYVANKQAVGIENLLCTSQKYCCYFGAGGWLWCSAVSYGNSEQDFPNSTSNETRNGRFRQA